MPRHGPPEHVELARMRMSVAEFRRLGYLQEVNRVLLHPLGLALEVTVDPDGTERISGIWDSRDDPEGITYANEITTPGEFAERAQRIGSEWSERANARVAALGYHIQPAGRGLELGTIGKR